MKSVDWEANQPLGMLSIEQAVKKEDLFAEKKKNRNCNITNQSIDQVIFYWIVLSILII